MLRLALYAAILCLAGLVLGCKTSEIKNENAIGLAADIPSASDKSGYADGRGDSVGGGGGAPPVHVEGDK